MGSDPVKDAINQRFIEALNLLVERKLFNSPRDYGLKNDIKAATISDLKYGRSHVDIRHIYNLASQFPFVSLDYIILGKGGLIRMEITKEDIRLRNQEAHNPSGPGNENLLERIEKLEKIVKKILKDE